MRGMILVLAAATLSAGAALAQDVDDLPVEVRDLGDIPSRFEFGPEIRPERLPPVEASCFVRFDISRHGLVNPESVVADCDEEDYVETAIAMITSRMYEPLIVDGGPQAQLGVTTELRFREAG